MPCFAAHLAWVSSSGPIEEAFPLSPSPSPRKTLINVVLWTGLTAGYTQPKSPSNIEVMYLSIAITAMIDGLRLRRAQPVQ